MCILWTKHLINLELGLSLKIPVMCILWTKNLINLELGLSLEIPVMCILWTKHLINLNLGCVTMLSFIPSTYQGTCNQEKSEHFIYVYKPNLKETKPQSSEAISEKYLQILEEIFYMYIYKYMSVFSKYKYIIIATLGPILKSQLS